MAPGRCSIASSCLPAACCLLLAVSTGCAHVPLNPRYAGPNPLPQAVASYYRYPNPPTQVTVTARGEHRRFREWLVRFPLSVPEGFEPTEPVVECEWFESRQPGRRAAILFNPILGGDYPLERGICRYLASHGFHVALVHRKTLKVSPDEPVDHLELLLRQGVLRIRQVVDWMASNERVDPARMGSFGISMGGMATVVTAAVEPRLRIAVVALAGGGIPDVLVASTDPLITRPRLRYLAQNHLDLAQFEALLRVRIKTDPVRVAPYVDARRLLMFIALADRTIGRTNALRLWRALGRPEVVWLPLGHYTTYLYLPYLKYRSLRFFQEHL